MPQFASVHSGFMMISQVQIAYNAIKHAWAVTSLDVYHVQRIELVPLLPNVFAHRF